MNVLTIVTGSVSARIESKFHYRLLGDGHNVIRICTEHARIILDNDKKAFRSDYGPLCISALKETEDWRDGCETLSLMGLTGSKGYVKHINLVRWADLCIVFPADYNILGKMACGIADDFVSTTLAAWIGSEKPLWVCEAMNSMMYDSKIRKLNRARLEEVGVRFIEPTVRRLACGDFGIGALADSDTVANIIEGHRWVQPIGIEWLINTMNTVYLSHSGWATDINGPKLVEPKADFSFSQYIPRYDEPGSFGAIRKYDIHQGVDIYCHEWAGVHAVEDGNVVDSYQYTGSSVGSEWWNDTWCIKVKGLSGVVTYSELKMPSELESGFKMIVVDGKEIYRPNFFIPSEISDMMSFTIIQEKPKYPAVGDKVCAGDLIGYVGSVLKDGKRRFDIRNHNTCMLHIELRTENCHLDAWKTDGERDRRLLDPTPYLKLIGSKNG